MSWWVEAGPKGSSQQLPCQAESCLVNEGQHSLLPAVQGARAPGETPRLSGPRLSERKANRSCLQCFLSQVWLGVLLQVANPWLLCPAHPSDAALLPHWDLLLLHVSLTSPVRYTNSEAPVGVLKQLLSAELPGCIKCND